MDLDFLHIRLMSGVGIKLFELAFMAGCIISHRTTQRKGCFLGNEVDTAVRIRLPGEVRMGLIFIFV